MKEMAWKPIVYTNVGEAAITTSGHLRCTFLEQCHFRSGQSSSRNSSFLISWSARRDVPMMRTVTSSCGLTVPDATSFLSFRSVRRVSWWKEDYTCEAAK